VAEGAPLLREYVGKTCIEGSNPSGSAKIICIVLILLGFMLGASAYAQSAVQSVFDDTNTIGLIVLIVATAIVLLQARRNPSKRKN
jgi:membrane protein DedA with SNARE-associated domain